MGDVSKNMEKAINNLDNALLAGLEKVCQMIENTAKEECPVDDGPLRADIQHVIDKNKKIGIIGNTLEYAPYRHEGTGIYAIGGNGRKEVPWRYKDAKGKWRTTKGIKPKRYLLTAVNANRNNILKVLGEGARTEWMK